MSLANTQEPLFVVNRSGSRPSHEGAPAALDKAIALCRRGGFKDILLRGDTDFSMTQYLDRWHEDGVRFVLGYKAAPSLKSKAGGITDDDYEALVRETERVLKAKPRKKPARVREAIVRERGYLNQVLESEDVAEFDHQPTAAEGTYRMVVLKKTIIEERGQQCLDTVVRYFFYITNDRGMTKEEVVLEANGRCDQENLNAHLKGDVRALRAPLNTLEANWAYMVMVSLAWSLKAWFALLLPSSPR